MEDKIQTYRQPLVTATGLILGFLLNYNSAFAKNDNNLSDLFSYIVGICILIGIICLIIVLSRILQMNYPKDKAEAYYQKTLNYFLAGLSISFIGVMIDVFASFMTD